MNNISNLYPDTMVDEGKNGQQQRLSGSVFSHTFSSHDIYQTETGINDPSSDNVEDMWHGQKIDVFSQFQECQSNK